MDLAGVHFLDLLPPMFTLCPTLGFALLSSLLMYYLALIYLFLHDISNSFWIELGVNVIIWTILACASPPPPQPSVSSLTVLAPLLRVLHEGKSYLRNKLLSSVLVLDTSIFVPPLIKRLCLRLFLYITCNPELSHVMPGEPYNQKG